MYDVDIFMYIYIQIFAALLGPPKDIFKNNCVEVHAFFQKVRTKPM